MPTFRELKGGEYASGGLLFEKLLIRAALLMPALKPHLQAREPAEVMELNYGPDQHHLMAYSRCADRLNTVRLRYDATEEKGCALDPVT